MEEKVKFEDAIEFLSFAPMANKRRLSGDTFSIWNTNEKLFGVTFSADITQKVPVTHRALSIAVNRLSNEVYFVFGKRGDITLTITGGKDNIFWIQLLKTNENGDQVWVVKDKLT